MRVIYTACATVGLLIGFFLVGPVLRGQGPSDRGQGPGDRGQGKAEGGGLRVVLPHFPRFPVP